MPNTLETFDRGLGISNLAILFKIYDKEWNSKESRIVYENFLKVNYSNEYNDFLDYKSKVKAKTHNIKELIFDWMDGKRELPEFKLFDVYND